MRGGALQRRDQVLLLIKHIAGARPKGNQICKGGRQKGPQKGPPGIAGGAYSALIKLHICYKTA